MAFNPANPYDAFFSGQGRRSYNNIPDTKQFSFLQAFNPNYINGAISGQFQPLTTDDQGALRVNIGTGVNITATITGLEVQLDNVAVTGGNINVNGFSTLTGQVNTLIATVATLTGSTQWAKTRTTGFASIYGAITGSCLVNKVMGYSKTTVVPGFIQLFDLAVPPTNGATPDFVCATQPNNYFLDLAENGVRFVNGLQVANSSTADSYTAMGSADFTAAVVYKQ